jgi:hypothetical protein
MPADEMLCTAQDVINLWPAFANLPAGEQTSLLNTSSQAIINYCRRLGFTQQFEDELVDGRGRPYVWLRRLPIVSITAVFVDTIPVTPPFTWIVKPQIGQLFHGNGQDDPRYTWRFPLGTRNVRVQYMGGYQTIPDPIVRAAAYYCRYQWEQSRISGLYQSERIGDYNYTLFPHVPTMIVPPYVAQLCSGYIIDDGPL